MPLWPARPEPWPSTGDDALALPAHWHVSERFLRTHTNSPDLERRSLLIRSYIAFLYNSFVPAQWLNAFLWKCIALIVVVGLVRRLITPSLVRRLPRTLRRAHTSFVRHCSLAPLVGSKALAARSVVRSQLLGPWTTVQVPLRPHAVILAFYVAANVLVVTTGYDVPWPNGFYSEEQGRLAPLIRHAADRSGVLALGSTPLTFLLAARNSPITWLTGADFGTVQVYHRWVARVTYGNATVHMLGYSLIHLQAYDWSLLALFNRWYIVLGWVAFFGGLVLCFGAWRRIRQVAYELFLVLHILAALAWVVGAYLHVFLLGERGARDEYLQLCYLTVALWAFDRGARRALVLWHNTRLGGALCLSTRRPSRPTRRQRSAEGVLFGGSNDFVRLRITPTSPWSLSRGGPGTFVHVSCYSAGHRVWESHPFSIAWPLGVPDDAGDVDDDCGRITTPSSCANGSSPSKGTRLDDLVHAATRAEGASTGHVHPFDEQASPESFELLVKRYSGFTQALVDSLSLPPSAVLESATEEPLMLSAVEDSNERPKHRRTALRIVVEGPYGAACSSHPCATARQALLVAGGSGLAMVTSQLADLGLRVLRECGETRCERVAVVWTVREAETVELIVPYLRRLYYLFHASPSFRQRHLDPSLNVDVSAARSPFLDLHVSVTSPPSPSSPSLAALAALSLPRSFLRLSVHADEGRPDVGAHIDALSASASTGGDRPDELLVVSCGPAALCDAAREAVRSRLGGPGREEGRDEKGSWEACRLMYSEEAVVW